jgi:hypothetical protein
MSLFQDDHTSAFAPIDLASVATSSGSERLNGGFRESHALPPQLRMVAAAQRQCSDTDGAAADLPA